MADAKITLETIASDEGLRRLNSVLADGTQNVARLQRELKNLEKETQSGTQATTEQANAMKNLRMEIQQQKQANAELSKAIKTTVSDLSNVGSASGNASSALSQLGNALGISVGSFSSLNALALGLAATVGVALVGAIREVVSTCVSLGQQFEQASAHFGAMVNSTVSGTEALRLFNTVGRDTTYDVAAVEQWGRDLMNVGYSATNAAAMIKLCSDTAAALGQDQSGAERLISTISRIQSTGEMSSRQLITLQQSGIDMDKVFSAVGMTAEEVMDALDKGTLNAQDAVQALTDYMGSEFDGAMARSKENVVDSWGDVAGNMEAICGSIGGAIFDAFDQSGIIQTLIDFTQDLLDLVWSDGESAFSEFGQVAQFALGLVDDALEIVFAAIKTVIMIGYSMIDAFRSIGRQIAAGLAPILSPLKQIWGIISSIVSTLGHEVKSGINAGWAELVGPTVRTPELSNTGNRFHTARRGGSSAGGGGSARSGGGQVSQAAREEQRQVDALIRKYSDLNKLKQESDRTEVSMMKLKASMLTGEAKSAADRQIKLIEYKNANDDLMARLNQELELTNKITDAETKKDTVSRIQEKIKAQRELYDLQVASVEYQRNLAAQQANTKGLMAGFMQDPEDIKTQLNALKETLTSTLASLDSAMAQPDEGEQLAGIAKILKMTPDALQEELTAKNATLQTFVDQYKAQLEATTEAESKNMVNAKIWKDTVKGYWAGVGKSLGDAFADILSGTKSAGEALGDFAKSAIQSALKIAAEWTALVMLYAAFGDPTPGRSASKTLFGMKYANGGFVSGPGTGTSDSIPARLSNGEYVINAGAVAKVGRSNLDAINAGRMPTSLEGTDGTVVAGGNVTLNVSAIDASGFGTFLQNGGIDTIKQALFDGNRNFTSAAGVW